MAAPSLPFHKMVLHDDKAIAVKRGAYKTYDELATAVREQLQVVGHLYEFHIEAGPTKDDDTKWVLSDHNLEYLLENYPEFRVMAHGMARAGTDRSHKSALSEVAGSIPTPGRMFRNVTMRNLQPGVSIPHSPSMFDSDFDGISAMPENDQVRVLKGQVEHMQNMLKMAAAARFDIQADTMNARDVETMRAVFDSLDHDESGLLGHDQLRELHSRLGEQITDQELKEIIKEIDREGRGEIDFNMFLSWWQNAHRGGKRSRRYRKRFKMVSNQLKSKFDTGKLVIKRVGKKLTPEFRVTFHYQQLSGHLKQISPWHDIPCASIGGKWNLVHFICEVPKWTRAKYEISTGEEFNPIKQDMKHGKLRFYQHGDMMFNYGALPQTWENPKHVPEDTGCPGDNDPLDAIELGTKQLRTGSVTEVKVLGVLALLDSGETDWKILVINIDDPLANLINDVHQIDEQMPGALKAIREYLRIYKVVSGNAENQYAFRGEAMNQEYALKVIEECHGQWRALRAGNADESHMELPKPQLDTESKDDV